MVTATCSRNTLKSMGLYNSKFNYVICDFLQIKLYLVKWRHFILSVEIDALVGGVAQWSSFLV